MKTRSHRAEKFSLAIQAVCSIHPREHFILSPFTINSSSSLFPVQSLRHSQARCAAQSFSSCCDLLIILSPCPTYLSPCPSSWPDQAEKRRAHSFHSMLMKTHQRRYIVLSNNAHIHNQSIISAYRNLQATTSILCIFIEVDVMTPFICNATAKITKQKPKTQ